MINVLGAHAGCACYGASGAQCWATKSTAAGEIWLGATEMITPTTSAGCWADGDIDSPGKRAGTSRVHNEFDAARRELNTQLRDASSVGAVATAALEQGPKGFIYVRVKEDPKELVPRRGLVSEAFTTYLDLAEFCVALVVGGGLRAAAILPDYRRGVLRPQRGTAEPSRGGDQRAPALKFNNRSWTLARRDFFKIPKIVGSDNFPPR